MITRFKSLFLILAISTTFMPAASAIEDSAFVKFSTSELSQGRDIWMANCKGCHAYGTAGAPVPMIPEEWQKRVIKDRDTLYDHAINGFFGEDDTMMPERGGNPELSDSQVKLAVDYMVALAIFYIETKN